MTIVERLTFTMVFTILFESQVYLGRLDQKPMKAMCMVRDSFQKQETSNITA